YYKWTQWVFTELYNSWYDNEANKARPISELVEQFQKNGTYGVEAAVENEWHKKLDLKDFPFGDYFVGEFTATDWEVLNEKQREAILEHYRLAYLADTWVNWCEALGTVLANDEIKDGRSERGGHPVEQRLMKQWSLRITVYADRLIEGLDKLDWHDSIKEIQRNWIGKSRGAAIRFKVDGHPEQIDVFTTRPDTIFGTSFMVLAPEHPLVKTIVSDEQKPEIDAYVKKAMAKSERDRQSDVKTVTGAFTGAYAVHPFSGDKLPVWISDYVLAGYGTGAVMAVPCGDDRDWAFAKHFNLPIPNIFKDIDISEGAYSEKSGTIANSGFLNDLSVEKATEAVIFELEQKRVGYGKTNYRLRDAIFSRQRYWGEPFPVYYEGGQTSILSKDELPLTLPKVDKYLPTEDGEPPLARAKKEDWPIFKGDAMEHNTMPGWAGSSWYFLRYMDPKNASEMVAGDKVNYWGAVDLYMGGAEHATGHLLYARFWTKFLFDRGVIPFDEPFTKMVNQGMILGRSSLVYRLELASYFIPESEESRMPSPQMFPSIFVTKEIYDDWAKDEEVNRYKREVESKLELLLHEALGQNHGMDVSNAKWEYSFTRLHVDVGMVENDELDVSQFKKWRNEYSDSVFILNAEEKYICGSEVEKMSKRWFNVVTPDELCERYGADTLRLYEMFLGPVEQSKPWDTQGISGVHNFLRKFWRLFFNDSEKLDISTAEPDKKEMKVLHQAIKKVSDDLDR
ncbi:MAG: class I tRNA ligase family protein, partial [Flavobacteriales bacterium]|nr:class I tRNA ligase family protein [Flavobacteriales bacterium]